MRLALMLLLSLTISACSDNTSPSPLPKVVGFYDYDANHKLRTVRNDLEGTLSGMVQVTQTHTIDPKGNAEKFMTSLITERVALLLFTPTTDISDSIKDITVDLMFDNKIVKSFVMSSPEDILGADPTIAFDYEIGYSKRAWSIELDWALIEHGMELKFTANKSDDTSRRAGVLATTNIEFSISEEGIFPLLRLGMLTEFSHHSGNSIGALVDTIGNEFNYESGHAYVLGYYPKPADKPDFWTGHRLDSGWDYDAYKNRIKDNILCVADPKNVNATNSFFNRYNYTSDTMLGGYSNSALSIYAHLTGFSARNTQNRLSTYSVITDNSSTKYLQWDNEQKKMMEYTQDKK